MEKSEHQLTWEAFEFEHYPKSPLWMMTSLALTFIGVALALWQKNLLFALFIIIAETMILTWAEREPRVLQFAVNKEGVHIMGHRSHAYQTLKHFAVFDSPMGDSHIILAHENRMNPHTKIPIPYDEVQTIRKFLRDHLEERSYESSIPEAITRLIKF